MFFLDKQKIFGLKIKS